MAGATVPSLTSISVTFSEAVTGVDAGDLYINAGAAQFLTGSGAGPYVFTFTQPAAGAVNVSWAGDHGIAGQAGTGAFVASTWAYTLTDTIAPTVTLLSPSASAVLASFTQVEVVFSENVTGVNASDLLVNGVAAAGMTGSGAGPFVFTFPQPAAGTVALAWAAGHGIKDTATVPNNFAGGSWSVLLLATGHGSLRLNEFLASNGTGMADETAVQEDWIEIYNSGATTANPAEGKYQYIPWDEENTLLDTTIDRVSTTDLPSGLHAKMLGFAQYKLDFADRVQKHMIAPGVALTLAANVARWQKWQAVLDKPIVAESCRWGDYRRDVHRYLDGTFALYTREDQWLTENARIVGTYLPGRTATVMTQLQTAGLYPATAAPEYRQTTVVGATFGTSAVAVGAVVAMYNPGGAGTLYYTLDGNDPHILYTPTSGTTFAASGTGTAYTTPLTIGATTTIKSRILSGGGVWSALNEATFSVGISAASVLIAEFLAANAGAYTVSGATPDFVEIQNTSGAAANETADPDGDGLSNLAEFLANTNPLGTATTAERTAGQALGSIETSAGAPTFLTLDLRVNRRAALNAFAGEGITSLTSP